MTFEQAVHVVRGFIDEIREQGRGARLMLADASPGADAKFRLEISADVLEILDEVSEVLQKGPEA